MSLPKPQTHALASASTDRLAESVQRLADLSPAPLVLVDRHAIRYANPAFAALCQVTVAELVGRPFADIVHAADQSHVQERLSEHQAGRADTYRAQFRVCPPRGGEGRWIYATLAAVRIGDEPATLATALDATERRGAQEAVSRAQRLDVIARLAGELAHRLNNTLQVVLGHAEKVGAALPPAHPAAASAREIRRGAETAATLADQLLSLGQRQVLDPKAVDVSRVIAELKGPIERRLGPSIALVISRSASPASAWVDGARLVHIVAALVDRARDAMSSGGELVIETALATVDGAARRERPWLREGDFVRVTFSDSGVAVAPETAAQAFEPFAGGASPSDGLALASAYGLIKQSQGFVWFEPNPSGGNRTVVLLPSVAVPVTAPTVATSLRVVGGASVAPRTSVLLVEDDPSVRELLTEALERNGFSADPVGSAEEALAKPIGDYDVLLTDISLPGMTGVELARLVRQRTPSTKVLMMSGFAREEFLTPADNLPFIGKPFTSKAIVERLRALVNVGTPGHSPSVRA